jgi:hypothetical protein
VPVSTAEVEVVIVCLLLLVLVLVWVFLTSPSVTRKGASSSVYGIDTDRLAKPEKDSAVNMRVSPFQSWRKGLVNGNSRK